MTVLGLGIETSCDETSCGIVENGRVVLANVISTQISTHQAYGGVVPEIASRLHVESIIPTISQALQSAHIELTDLSYISVTKGPGLVGALLVGLSAAKGIALGTGLPLIGVHHIEAHIKANYLSHLDLKPPFICLVVSGGHSQIVWVEDNYHFRILAQTRDDAAGEALDKVARALGLGYPGGPIIDKMAQKGDPLAFNFPKTKFKEGLDFSFSGIKTAALNQFNQLQMKNAPINLNDFVASFQHNIMNTLVDHALIACKEQKISTLCLAGGVSANSYLRRLLQEKATQNEIHFYYPALEYCTDNGAMIAAAGFDWYNKSYVDNWDANARANWPLNLR